MPRVTYTIESYNRALQPEWGGCGYDNLTRKGADNTARGLQADFASQGWRYRIVRITREVVPVQKMDNSKNLTAL